MSAKQTTAMTTAPAPGAVALPDYMEPVKNHIANIGSRDILRPYLQIGQYTSAAVKEGEVKAGVFYNSISLATFGTEMEIQVLAAGKIFQRMDKQGQKVLCMSTDCKVGRGNPGGDCTVCKMQEWPEEGSQRKRPECGEVGRMLVMIPGQPESLMVLSLKTSALKTWRRLCTMWSGNNAPLYGRKLMLSTQKQNNEGNEYFSIEVDQDKEFVSKENYLMAREIAETIGKAFVHEAAEVEVAEPESL